MIDLSICIEQRYGRRALSWPRWQQLTVEIESLGFDGLYVADHLPDGAGTVETMTSLAWVADHTRRVRFGPLVSPLSIRHPTLLAWQAASLDDLSGGRFIVGVGTGWLPRDDEVYGFALGDIATRTARLEEGLQILRGLLRAEAPVTFNGQFFRLGEAELRPPPRRAGGPPILVGGNGRRRMLPLTARYADIWNAIYLSPASFTEYSGHLDQLIVAAGRSPSEVRRTLYLSVICGRDAAELEGQADWIRTIIGGLDGKPLPDLLAAAQAEYGPVLERLGASWCPIIGRPDEVIAQIKAYAAAGVDELIFAWYEPENLIGLRILAEHVLPFIR